MQDLFQKVIDWANDRNLIKGSTPIKQGLKLMSEYGELCDSITKNDFYGIKDAIGDIMVVAIIIATQHDKQFDSKYYEWASVIRVLDDEFEPFIVSFLAEKLLGVIHDTQELTDLFRYLGCVARNYGLTLEQCLEHAYNEIKDRKGVMYDGVFIKETDTRYQEIIKELNQ